MHPTIVSPEIKVQKRLRIQKGRNRILLSRIGAGLSDSEGLRYKNNGNPRVLTKIILDFYKLFYKMVIGGDRLLCLLIPL